eukprot:TRINITY_DN29478_c0_g1_i2.p3 TRINITY_DN29478_c0_g1~~TRINITY_DN29478_c0_g1_i2.p3  ORF type:complete len:239 (+),score=51.91 TRINITY_DN29478_c0_g1_i2:680-1396(+)
MLYDACCATRLLDLSRFPSIAGLVSIAECESAMYFKHRPGLMLLLKSCHTCPEVASNMAKANRADIMPMYITALQVCYPTSLVYVPVLKEGHLTHVPVSTGLAPMERLQAVAHELSSYAQPPRNLGEQLLCLQFIHKWAFGLAVQMSAAIDYITAVGGPLLQLEASEADKREICTRWANVLGNEQLRLWEARHWVLAKLREALRDTYEICGGRSGPYSGFLPTADAIKHMLEMRFAGL